MSYYYVTHPNWGTSAMVDAPATEKARTTFLDYLERQGQINRSDRQYWRRSMVAERIEHPEDVRADIELHYGYEGAVTQGEFREATPEDYAGILEAQGRGDSWTEEEEFEGGDFRHINVIPEGQEFVDVEELRPGLSPIAKRALRGYVR